MASASLEAAVRGLAQFEDNDISYAQLAPSRKSPTKSSLSRRGPIARSLRYTEYSRSMDSLKKRPLLREEDAAKRLVWAKERKDWTVDEWKKVIWTDECSVERGTGKSRRRVFRTPVDKWKKEYIRAVPKGKDVSVMVWAAFWGDGRSELNQMERDSLAKKGDTQRGPTSRFWTTTCLESGRRALFSCRTTPQSTMLAL